MDASRRARQGDVAFHGASGGRARPGSWPRSRQGCHRRVPGSSHRRPRWWSAAVHGVADPHRTGGARERHGTRGRAAIVAPRHDPAASSSEVCTAPARPRVDPQCGGGRDVLRHAGVLADRQPETPPVDVHRDRFRSGTEGAGFGATQVHLPVDDGTAVARDGECRDNRAAPLATGAPTNATRPVGAQVDETGELAALAGRSAGRPAGTPSASSNSTATSGEANCRCVRCHVRHDITWTHAG